MNDFELIYYCHQKNEESFNLLLNKYTRYIYYIINLFKKNYYFFGSDDNDLYNEAVILLYECIDNYRDDLNVKFSSYYLACLKKRYMHMIRIIINNKNKVHSTAISLDASAYDDDLNLYNIIGAKQLSISEQINNNYLIDSALTTLKNHLNELEKQIIFYYLSGYSYKEIEKILTISTKKVDNSIQKYRKLIYKCGS